MEQFAQLTEFFHAAPVGVLLLSLREQVDKNGNAVSARTCGADIVFMNNAWRAAFPKASFSGKSSGEILGMIDPGVDWDGLMQLVFNSAENVNRACFSEICLKWFSVSLFNLKGYVVVTLTDISNAEDMILLLHYQANAKRELVLNRNSLNGNVYFDSLTGLANITCYNEIIDTFVNSTIKKEKRMGLMLINVDNLGVINNSSGWGAGDALLKNVADVLTFFADHNTLAFRFAGNEFIMLFLNLSDYGQAVSAASIISDEFIRCEINVSSGLALMPKDGNNKEELLLAADIAMREVRHKIGKRMVIFEPHMKKQFLHRVVLENKMTEAYLGDGFELYFQPQIDIASNRLRGFEALIRWHDADLGWISPSEFIPIAEETRQIIAIGNWALEQALRTLNRWRKEYSFEGVMCVNISPLQMRSPDFFPNLKALMQKYNPVPGCVELEITEGVFIDDSDRIIDLLNNIRRLGLKIAIDDFGTGYASFGYLQEMPVTALKIDKVFTKNLSSEKNKQFFIISSMITLAKKINLETIAEGVENPAELKAVSDMGCDYIQGYLTGKPMPACLCEKMLSDNMPAALHLDGPQSLRYTI